MLRHNSGIETGQKLSATDSTTADATIGRLGQIVPNEKILVFPKFSA